MCSRALALAAVVAANVFLVAACRPSDPETSRGTTGSTTSAPAAAATDSAATPLGGHTAAELDSAARAIIGFLRGENDFDRIRVADTVTFYVSPEGGGARTVVGREQLRDRSRWTARGPGGSARSLVPPPELPELTTRVGRHINCMEYPLSSRFPELARLPHVGTKLEPANASTCLETRNLTLVFDPTRKPPTLVAVVYDQWEW